MQNKMTNYNTLTQEQKKKKILFISDDFSSLHFNSLKNLLERRNNRYDDCNLEFEFFLAEEFGKIPKGTKFDAVFIDYGFIDNCFDKLEYCLNKLDKFEKNGISLVWCGGLPNNYNSDAIILFPKRKYLHNLLSCSIAYDEIFFILKKLFDNKLK
jgi:hypothetical protein